MGFEKAKKEEVALRMLNEELYQQKQVMEQNTKISGGMVTSYRMEELLKQQYNKTVEGYKSFIMDS